MDTNPDVALATELTPGSVNGSIYFSYRVADGIMRNGETKRYKKRYIKEQFFSV